jgi:hypothetical protein
MTTLTINGQARNVYSAKLAEWLRGGHRGRVELAPCDDNDNGFRQTLLDMLRQRVVHCARAHRVNSDRGIGSRWLAAPYAPPVRLLEAIQGQRYDDDK